MTGDGSQSGTKNGRFMLFAGSRYYPAGGAVDLIGRFDSVSDALVRRDVLDGAESYTGAPPDWAHIYDVDAAMTVGCWDRDDRSGEWSEADLDD